MAEQPEQPSANGSSSVSDETLRLYLLCRLDQDERLRLDERLLADDGLAERVRLAESELTDDYAAGRLEPFEQALFAERFLVTDERKRNLRFASAVRGYAGSGSPASTPAPITPRTESSWRSAFAGLFDFNRPAALAAVSFGVLILIVGLVWLIARQRSETQPLIARNEPIPNSSPQVSASPASALPSPTPTRKPEVKPTPIEPLAPPAIASFVLTPGAIRGGGGLSRIAVPRGDRDIVRLSLVLETSAEGTYEAELTTAEEQKVFLSRKLKPLSGKEPKVVLDVPARRLQSGDYQIKLTHRKANGETESAGQYYFRALQE